MKNDDEIYNDIKFLDYDSNYTHGYQIYEGVDVFSIEHPLGKSAACSSGQIIACLNNFEFKHNIGTDNGSSGCPIILINDNINIIQVIGIHKEGSEFKKTNFGSFIGEIFNDNNYVIYKKNLNNNDLNNSDQNLGNIFMNNLNKENLLLLDKIDIIYIDYNIDYKMDMIKKTNLDVDSAITLIKSIRFHEAIIIVNEKLFVDFVRKFDENLKDIYIIPNIIIYSPKKRNILLPDSIHNKKFYVHKQLYSSKEVNEFLESYFKNRETAGEISETNHKPSNSELIFQIIRNKSYLNLPLFYKILLDILKVDDDKFIKSIKIFKNDQGYKYLINPIINIPDIPIELLSKYYVRMLTVNGNFYSKIIADLSLDYNKNNIIYQSYIKTLYEGVEKRALKPLKTFENIQLYSAQHLTKIQMEELELFKKSKVDYYEMPVVFSKKFLSFTKEKINAEHLMKSYEKNSLLTIVGANTKYDLNSHADIEELSCFGDEKEVLFFPFSGFGIEDYAFDPVKKIYNIKLIYLGRFIKDFEKKKTFNIESDKLPEPYFIELFKKSGLIDDVVINQLKENLKENEFKIKKAKERVFC